MSNSLLNILYNSRLKDFLVLLLFVYLPQIKLGSFIFNSLLIFISIAIIKSVYTSNFKFPKFFQYILGFQFIFLSFSNIINGYIETTLWKELIIFPLLYSSGYILINDILRIKGLNYLIRLLVYVLITNSLIIIFFSVFRDLNPLLHKIIHITSKQSKYIYDMPFNLRHSGIAVSGFSYLSFKISCIFIIILYYASKKKNINSSLFYFLSFTLLISQIFIAKTGLFLSGSAFLIYLYFNTIKALIFFGSGILIIFFIFLYPFLSGEMNQIVGAVERSFDIFLSDEGSETVTILQNQFDSTKTNNYILGDGDYGRVRGLITDIGFLSYLKGGGILGLIILTSHWIFLSISNLRQFKTNWIKQCIVILALLHLFFNSKELVFYSHGYMQSIILILVIDDFTKNNDRYDLI